METKNLTAFEIKSEDEGIVSAIVSVMGVVDADKDVLLPGSITSGTTVALSAYGHDVLTEGKPPVGKGVVTMSTHGRHGPGTHGGTPNADWAIFEGKYFLETARARDAWATVKALGAGGSAWSIGYHRVKTAPLTAHWISRGASRVIRSLELVEVSPVFRGANPYATTLGVKADDFADVGNVNPDHAALLAIRAKCVHYAEYARARGGVRVTEGHTLYRVVMFGAKQLGISSAPAVYLAPRSSIRDSAEGCYDGSTDTVYVADDLGADDRTVVLFHELWHAAERRAGRDHSEVDAYAAEVKMFDAWTRERQRQELIRLHAAAIRRDFEMNRFLYPFRPGDLRK